MKSHRIVLLLLVTFGIYLLVKEYVMRKQCVNRVVKVFVNSSNHAVDEYTTTQYYTPEHSYRPIPERVGYIDTRSFQDRRQEATEKLQEEIIAVDPPFSENSKIVVEEGDLDTTSTMNKEKETKEDPPLRNDLKDDDSKPDNTDNPSSIMSLDNWLGGKTSETVASLDDIGTSSSYIDSLKNIDFSDKSYEIKREFDERFESLKKKAA
jgi:hypothetical protein